MENFQDSWVWIRDMDKFQKKSWIQIRFVLRDWIRIRSISERIRNPDQGLFILFYLFFIRADFDPLKLNLSLCV